MKRLIYILALAVAVTAMAQSTLTHVAKKGETLYGIAKTYGKSLEELQRLNPGLNRAPHKGEIVVIALPKNVEASSATEDASARKADIASRQANRPSTPATSVDIKLTKNQRKEMAQIAADAQTRQRLADSLRQIAEAEAEAEAARAKAAAEAARPVTRNVVALLPLMLEQKVFDKNARLTTDFLRGVLMAANETRNHGADSLRITVLDTENSMPRLLALLDSIPALQEPGVIIAPSDTAAIAALGEHARTHGQLVVNTYNAKDEHHLANPSILQTNIASDLMNAKAIAFMLQEYPQATIVTLRSRDARNDKEEFVAQALDSLRAHGLAIKELTYGKRLEPEQIDTLDSAAQYLFIPLTASTREFHKIYPALHSFKTTRATDPDNVQLWGYPDMSAYRGDNLEKLQALRSTIFTRFYDNPEAEDNAAMAREFKRLYGRGMFDGVPKQALMGYDMMRYILGALDGRKTYDRLDTEPFEGLQSAYRFPEGANSNEALIIIRFEPDGSIHRVVI